MDDLNNLSDVHAVTARQKDVSDGIASEHECTKHKRASDDLVSAKSSGSSKTPEGSSGRERIKIIFKRKAPGEERAVNVIVGPPSEKKSRNGSWEAISHSPHKSSDELIQEAKFHRKSGLSRGARHRERQSSEPSLQLPRKSSLVEKKSHQESEFGVRSISIAKDTLGQKFQVPSVIDSTSGSMVDMVESFAQVQSCQNSEKHFHNDMGCEYTDCNKSAMVFGEQHFAPPLEPLSLTTNRELVDNYRTGSENEVATSTNDPNQRPKAWRTPLGFPAQGLSAVDGVAQTMHNSSMTGSPNCNSVLPAKRSPLPLPLKRSPVPVQTENHVSSAESSGNVSSRLLNSFDQRSGTSENTVSVQRRMHSLSTCQSSATVLGLASDVFGAQRSENEVETQSMARDSSIPMTSRFSLDIEHGIALVQPDSVVRTTEHGENMGKGVEANEYNATGHMQVAQDALSPSLGKSDYIAHCIPGNGPVSVETSLLPSSDGLMASLPKFSLQGLINGDVSDMEADEEVEVSNECSKRMDHKDDSNFDSGKWDVQDLHIEHAHELRTGAFERSVSQQSDDIYHDQDVSSEMLYARRESPYLTRKHGHGNHPSHESDVDFGQSSDQPSISEGSASPSKPQMSSADPCQGSQSSDGVPTSSKVSKDLHIIPTVSNLSGGIRLKIKMSKGVTVTEVPGTSKALMATGLLEGHHVRYLDRGGGVMLTGVVRNGGILCDCGSCKGKRVVNVSCFEKHAGSTARHPSNHIFLENGRCIRDVLEAGWHATEGKVLDDLCNAIDGSGDNETKYAAAVSHQSHIGHLLPKCIGTGNYPWKSDPNSTKIVQSSHPREMHLHKLIFLPGGLLDFTELAYYVKGQRVLAGFKKGSGICCSCCKKVVSCSQFEAHAGWGSRRNPYNSIYLADGRSLHDVALEIAVQRESKMTSSSSVSKENDDVCAECGDGGNLVLCDGCPKAYHTECAGLARVPDGDWFCLNCRDQAGSEKKFLGRKSMRGSARPSAVSLREKLVGRCQRVVKVSSNSLGGCVICRNGDFLKTGFGARTIMLCDQCEREYHVGCMRELGLANLKELPAGEWFCSTSCKHIHNIFQALVLNGPELVHSGISMKVLEKQRMKNFQGELKLNENDLTWQLLHGRRGIPENGRILSDAAKIFAESFDPIVDESSGRDLISLMVYSRSIRDQDFRGMYCAVLKCKETVVSAAIIRVFGCQFAEMPLVATSSASRGQGYFQILLLSIEQLLGMLGVESIILPAAEGAEAIWTNKFGFSKMENNQLLSFRSQVQMMIFQGSSMMLKAIPRLPDVPFSSLKGKL